MNFSHFETVGEKMDSRKFICIFCGSSNRGAKTYENEAETLAKLMVENHYGLIFGGASVGLMKMMADAVLKYGGEVIGISTPDVEALRVNYTHPHYKNKISIIKENNLANRKQRMLEMSDAFIILPGGLGTYDELGEISIYNQFASYHNLSTNPVKPCCVLNINGFFDGTLMQLNRGLQESFIKENHFNLIRFFNNAQNAMEYICHFKNPKPDNTRWWEDNDMPAIPDSMTLLRQLNHSLSAQPPEEAAFKKQRMVTKN